MQLLLLLLFVVYYVGECVGGLLNMHMSGVCGHAQCGNVEPPTAHRPQPLSHSFARSFIYVNLNQHAKIST